MTFQCGFGMMVQVWGDLQDPHPRMPLRDAGRARGCQVRSGVAGSSVQANVPKEQGASAWPLRPVFPPGEVPHSAAEVSPGVFVAGGDPEHGRRHRGSHGLHIGLVGWWPCYQYIP